jgi:4-hydroxybenzoate polyprenyltransferase
MKGYIKALRLPIVVMAGLLVITAFRVSAWSTNAYLIALFIVIVSSAIMAHNDWRDKEHDAKKGKTFALNNSKPFKAMVMLLWFASLVSAIGLWILNPWYGILSGLVIVSGLIYSETRRIPLLPVLLVALTSASPALYANPKNDKVLAIFLVSALLVFGREILKDLDDCSHDIGYKWTLPIALGKRVAKFLAGLIVLVLPLVATWVSIKTLAGTPFLLISALCLILNKNHHSAKTLLDIGMATIIVVLLVSGP